MSKASFTPGPWRWCGRYLLQDRKDSDGNAITNPYSTPCGYPIADDGSSGGEYNATIDTDSPNARLIAACPKMFEYISKRAQEGDEDAAEIIASIG